MTDEIQVSAVLPESAAQVETSSEPVAAQPTESEKLLPQSEVSRIVGREVKQAVERERKRYETQQAPPAHTPSQSQATSSLGGMTGLTEDQIQQQILSVAQKMSNQAMADRIGQEFDSKIAAGREKYPDFDDKISILNLEQNPHLILWTNGLENTRDVLHDLAEYPSKFANILMLTHSGNHKAAEAELRKMSASIKLNEDAKEQHRIANAPLDQVTASHIGTDSGSMTPSDYKNQSWLRG